MNKEKQAKAYLQEAQNTLKSARIIYEHSQDKKQELWAQVVKNAYDALEQAVCAAIASKEETIPIRHPAKINKFIQLYQPPSAIQNKLLYWLKKRSSSQYVDLQGDEISVPHLMIKKEEAHEILKDAQDILQYVEGNM